jgi:hypothetical protein
VDDDAWEVLIEGPMEGALRQHQQSLVMATSKGNRRRWEGVREEGKEGGGDAGLVVGLEEGEEEAFEIEEPGERTPASAAAKELFAQKPKGAEVPVEDLEG